MRNMKKIAALLAAQMVLSALPMIAHATESMNEVTEAVNVAETLNMPFDTPTENVFYVEEKPFILLDSDASSETSSFFIYADQGYSWYPYYGDQKFRPNSGDSGRLGNLLNNVLIEKNGTIAGGPALPSSLTAAIDREHEWLTEEGHPEGGAPEPYTFKCGITLLSWTELKQYAPKIGYGMDNYVCLRTGAKYDNMKMLATYKNGYVDVTWLNNNVVNRPCFWIGENFFTSTKLDVSKMGANVKAELTKRYTSQELGAAGYTSEELKSIGYNDYTEAKISGTLKPGYTLTAEHLKYGDYAWYRCDSASDAGTLIEGITGTEYHLKNVDGGKFIKFVVSQDGENVETIISQRIDEPLNHNFTFGEVNKYWQPKVTPAENVFYVDGRKFILLDTLGDTSYIYADESYCNRPLYASQKFVTIDNADPGRTSVWMQTAFLSTGDNAIKIPKSISDKIDYNHVWLTEGGAADGPCPDDYTFTCGISLLSLTELRKYASKIGYDTSDYRIMRSGSTTDKNCMICTCVDGVIRDIDLPDGKTTIVPAFYLYNDFFKTTKLSLDTTGSAVWDAIRGMYTEDEMSAVYSKAELKQIGYGKTAEISGTLKPGYTVTAEPLAAGDSYNWYRCDTADASGELIPNVNTNTYTLVNADGGKYLKVESVKSGNVVETIVSDRIDNALINDITQDTELPGFPATTPAENLFVVEDDTQAQPFILLDSSPDKKSSFFIYTDDIVGSNCFYESQKFNPTSGDGGIVSVILNKGYLNGEWGVEGKKLPTVFKQYIDAEHVWLTEGGAADGPCPNDYITTAAVSLLSLTEARKYVGKFGRGTDYYTYLRTPSTTNNMMLLKTDTNGYLGMHWINNVGGVRPCFWIGEDFFKNVRLDLVKTGSNVKKAIRERYTMSEMAAIYDEDELATLGYNTAGCSVYNLTFTDEEGKEVSELRYAGNTLNVSATVASYASDNPVTMIVAVYNDNGDMIKASIATKDIAKGSETPMNVSTDLSSFDIGKGFSASVYFWNSLEGMVPIANSYTL